MKLSLKILYLIFFLLSSCAEYKVQKSDRETERHYYSSSGFALIYEDVLFDNKVVNKKLPNSKFAVLHSLLKANTPIKIINPLNFKTIETKIYRKANYPELFNIVISKEVALELNLDPNNPYVEITEVKKNKTFVAKEGNTHDEEKNVADKAPVDEIEMNDLSVNSTAVATNEVKFYSFIIVISDFYYSESANNLRNELQKKTKLKNISVKKINNNKYRLLVGPFENFNALKTTYISLNNLGFENLNVYKE